MTKIARITLLFVVFVDLIGQGLVFPFHLERVGRIHESDQTRHALGLTAVIKALLGIPDSGFSESAIESFHPLARPPKARYQPPMPRYALKVEYQGEPFAGWQRQKELPSVQGAIEQVLSRIEPGDHTIAAAGRTDAGVHALGQVAHCDLAREWDPFRLSAALNYHLKPRPVAILRAARVDDDWHPRFSALERQYLFRILMRHAPATHDRGQVWQVNHTLDLEAMQEGADMLVGRHDFTTFRSSICQAASPIKTLDELRVEQIQGFSGPEIHFHARARSFLHNQVRSFVGTLERVGAGAWAPEDVRTALEAVDRAACGPVCPPQGLYLARVEYPRPVFD